MFLRLTQAVVFWPTQTNAHTHTRTHTCTHKVGKGVAKTHGNRKYHPGSLTRARRGNRQLLFNGFRASSLQDVNTLKLGGIIAITWIHAVLLSRTPRNSHDAKYYTQFPTT